MNVDKIYKNLNELLEEFDFIKEKQRMGIVIYQICFEEYYVVGNIATRKNKPLPEYAIAYSIGNFHGLETLLENRHKTSLPIYDFIETGKGEADLTVTGIKEAVYTISHSYGELGIYFDRYLDDEFLPLNNILLYPYYENGEYFYDKWNDNKIDKQIIFEK